MSHVASVARGFARRLLLRNPVATILGVGISAFNRRNALIALIYHDIPEAQRSAFRRQMEFLQEHYHIVNPGTFVAMLAGEQPTLGRHVLITFDDGFSCQADAAERVLEPMGIQGLFFLSTGFVGTEGETAHSFITNNLKRQLTNGDAVPNHLLPMSWEDVSRLDAAGHTIGAHTVNHWPLPSLTDQQLLSEEIAGSGDAITEHTGKPVEYFTYPFGTIDHIDRRSMAVIKDCYRACFSGVRGGNRPGRDRYAILREAVDLDDGIGAVRFLVEGGLAPPYQAKARRLLEIASDGHGSR
jgi:peptidoglycan/xylan/chitin deacetylase (PgdA/CDA1 family)